MDSKDNMINFGIDLGTTNSVICKFEKGEIITFKNPVGWSETLPSIVGFKKDSIIVGSKARELVERKPKDVISRFKRKMGTAESYKIPALGQSKTPVELSAQVLKELKTFIHTGEVPEAVVITIPASFDTIQSNATKEAGLLAGFKQVILLQEPIAASLAYANKSKTVELKDGQWLVYDFGGGTFDVALVRIQDGEMKIIDHEGDNFLGGSDFDEMIVKKLLIPRLEKEGNFNNLEQQMTSEKGKYNPQYYSALLRAESAKIMLSAKTSAEIELLIEDESGDELDFAMNITRSEFEQVIQKSVDASIDLVKKILTRNSLTSNDLQFVLMVGGSTFIPYVRQRVGERLGVPINCDIDPTTAIAIGAAYYAGSKRKELKGAVAAKLSGTISIKMSYPQATKHDTEVPFLADIKEGYAPNLFYKIIREDGGFATALQPLPKRIIEDLPLVENSYNFFKLYIFDAQNNAISHDGDIISIYTVVIAGQSLPNDICLEIDDIDTGETRLELWLQKNSVLPLRKTVTKTLNRNLAKKSDDSYIIKFYEGSSVLAPVAALNIGYMEITGKQVSRDIAKGSEVEITIEISESRDITISAYFNMSDQEFKEQFKQNVRNKPPKFLTQEIVALSEQIDLEMAQAEQNEEYETAKALQPLQKKIAELQTRAEALADDDVTDQRYQLDDQKRKVAQELYEATKNKRTAAAKQVYIETKTACQKLVDEHGNDNERRAFQNIVSQEDTFLNSSTPQRIADKEDELDNIRLQILWRVPEFLQGIFGDLLRNHRTRMNDQQQATQLFELGIQAIKQENWDRLRSIDQQLIQLLPVGVQQNIGKNSVGFS